MLESISWQQFFTTISLIVAGYYLINSLLLFNQEIISFFKQRRSNESDSRVEEKPNDSSDPNDVIGKVRVPQQDSVSHEKLSTAEEVSFALPKEVEEPLKEPSIPKEDLIVGTVSDLLEEIKSLASSLGENKPDDVAPAFRQLLSRHTSLTGTPYQEALNMVIVGELSEKCSLNVESKDIDAWWPSTVATHLSSN